MTGTGGAGVPLSAAARRLIANLSTHAATTALPICLDSSALIDYVARQEPVHSLLAPMVLAPEVPVVVSTISLAELVTRPARSGDVARVRAIHAALVGLPGLTLVDFDQDHAVETAHVRAETNLHLPDAAIVATARRAGASALIGNDRRWRTRRLGVPYYQMDDILALP